MPEDVEKYTIQLSGELSPQIQSRRNFIAYIVGLRKNPVEKPGQALATATNRDGDEFPLVVISHGQPNVFFDLKATLDLMLREQYPNSARTQSIVSYLPFDYTSLPMWVVGLAFRLLTRKTDPDLVPDFPSFPMDDSVDVLISVSKGGSSIRSGYWPDGKKYALALTHDVDTDWMFRHDAWLEAFMSSEKDAGMWSAWYIVPTSTRNGRSKKGMERLAKMGFEIGVHGFKHDPNMAYENFDSLCEKLRGARKIMDWTLDGSPGYRAPWMSRSGLMRLALKETGYLYDSSSPTVDLQDSNALSNSGCCTLFPYFCDGLLVLPITLPQDPKYFTLGKTPAKFWSYIFDLVQEIKARNGVAVISTHIQPHNSANPAMLEGYSHLLKELSQDEEAWFALPRDIARWAIKNEMSYSVDPL